MYRLSASVESSSFGLFVCLFAWKVETSKMSNRSESKTRGYLLHYYYSLTLSGASLLADDLAPGSLRIYADCVTPSATNFNF